MKYLSCMRLQSMYYMYGLIGSGKFTVLLNASLSSLHKTLNQTKAVLYLGLEEYSYVCIDI